MLSVGVGEIMNHKPRVHYLLDNTVFINIQVFPSLTLYQTSLYRCVFRLVNIVLVI